MRLDYFLNNILAGQQRESEYPLEIKTQVAAINKKIRRFLRGREYLDLRACDRKVVNDLAAKILKILKEFEIREGAVWDYERLIKWVKESELDDNPEKYVDKHFDISADGIEMVDSLYLYRQNNVFQLPTGLSRIHGYLNIHENASLTELPKSLTTVDGYVALDECRISALPNNLVSIGGDEKTRSRMGGYLWIMDYQEFEFSDNLRIGGDVYVAGCSPAVIAKVEALREKGLIGGQIRYSERSIVE